jgi:hypothetical protein
MSPRLHEGTLADLRTLMGSPAKLHRGFTSHEYPISPIAGANLTYTVSSDYWKRILTFGFQMAASATGGPRDLNMNYLDGSGTTYLSVPIATGLVANRTIQCYGDKDAIPTGEAVSSLSAYGEQPAPAAGTTIATLTVPTAGLYEVEWTVEVGGTLAEGVDNDNFELVFNGGNIAQSVNAAVQGSYPQETVQFSANASATLLIKNIGIATAASVYSAELTLIPVSTQSVRFRIPDLILQPGWQVTVNMLNSQAADQLSGFTSLQEHYASDYASGTDALETEMFIDALLDRLANG